LTKILLFALALLVPAARLQSQDTSQAGSNQAETSVSDHITLEGCLQGTNGDYTLSANSGKTYQLQGDTSNLSAHVGHEVQITGPTSGASAVMPGIGTEADGTMPRLTMTVENMKHVSETCHAAR
jgi:hypothetical protein